MPSFNRRRVRHGLYADDEEVVLDAERPVMLNGIEALPTRSDLLDRSLFMTLPAIDDGTRRSEAELAASFEEARGRILGALLTALSKAMRELPTVKLDRMPRMADFARLGVAVERALGWPSESFLTAYETNRNEAHTIALEAALIGAPLEELMSNRHEWSGTATDLLRALCSQVPSDITHSRGWPTSPRHLSNQLSRLTPNLRKIGITITKDREGHIGTRVIRLQRDNNNSANEHDLKHSKTQDDKKTGDEKKTASITYPNLEQLSNSWRGINNKRDRR
jgi:hypothetical protein